MKFLLPVFLGIFLVFFASSCEEPIGGMPIEPDDENFVPVDWTDLTHSNKAAPDYETVFPQNQVNTLEINLGELNWGFIQRNMESVFGYSFGSSRGAGAPGFPDEDPAYVAVPVKFNGKEWYKVGFRLKGNSTLSTSWRNGIYKIPFRLNFDRYEDKYPQINNQRFYGFKELSMSPGAHDPSLIREKTGADIFNQAGIPSARTAFYKVYINFGTGLTYCGLYTMVEVIDDTMIRNRFGHAHGNIYKPESTFQSFVREEFEKKNNKNADNYSDVVNLISVLHSDLRTTHSEQWRQNLERVFNVDHFLKWLAVNTTMENWDTYGRMAHNYYLYNHPDRKLTWIPWDNNEALSNRGNATITIGLEGVTNGWPLIRYLMDDPVYAHRYRIHMRQFLTDVFTTSNVNTLLDNYHNLILPYVMGPQEEEIGKYTYLSNPTSFANGRAELKQHVAGRIQIAEAYLQQNGL